MQKVKVGTLIALIIVVKEIKIYKNKLLNIRRTI
jgi:hypothetical protein